MNPEVEILERAADYLESLGSLTVSNALPTVQVTTNSHSLFRVAPVLAKGFRETAEEYSEPDTAVLCEHCWDNVKMAKAILGVSDG